MTKKASDDCLFCRIARGEIPAEKVLEGDSFIAIKDINPMVEGHTLVIPKKHWVTFLDIPNNYGDELVEFMKKVIDFLMEDLNADGFNIVMNNLEPAGQIVSHAHFHIFPRREGDGAITGNHLVLE